MSTQEFAGWHCHVLVEKWDADQTRWARKRSGLLSPNGSQLAALHLDPYEVLEREPGNQLCDTSPATGMQYFMSRVFNIGTPPALSDNTHTGLGVGSTSTGDAGNETGLLYASSCWNPMDATYPTTAANTGLATLKASFSTAASDFAWNEYGAAVPNASGSAAVSANAVAVVPSGYALLNRKAPAALGTKSGGTWALTMTLTIS